MSAATNGDTWNPDNLDDQLEAMAFEAYGKKGYVARLSADELIQLGKLERQFEGEIEKALFYVTFGLCDEHNCRFWQIPPESESVTPAFLTGMSRIRMIGIEFVREAGQAFGRANKISSTELDKLEKNSEGTL